MKTKVTFFVSTTMSGSEVRETLDIFDDMGLDKDEWGEANPNERNNLLKTEWDYWIETIVNGGWEFKD